MTDNPPSLEKKPKQSYRECVSCGCQVHQSPESCPECGAFPHEDDPPTADSRTHVILTLAFVGFLGLALLGLSQNRSDAENSEVEKFSRLKQLPFTNESVANVIPLETIPTPTPVLAPTMAPTAEPTALPTTPVPLPTEAIQPHPTPLPPRVTSTSTPAPKPTKPSALDLKDQLADGFRSDLDTRFPMAKEGENVQLTTRENTLIRGTILRMEANRMSIRSIRGPQWIAYNKLSKKSRMRVDKSAREAWVEEQALEEILNRL